MKDDQSEEFYMWEREDFVLNSLINFEPVNRFKNRRNVHGRVLSPHGRNIIVLCNRCNIRHGLLWQQLSIKLTYYVQTVFLQMTCAVCHYNTRATVGWVSIIWICSLSSWPLMKLIFVWHHCNIRASRFVFYFIFVFTQINCIFADTT